MESQEILKLAGAVGVEEEQSKPEIIQQRRIPLDTASDIGSDLDQSRFEYQRPWDPLQ